jgi:hypothetical protein
MYFCTVFKVAVAAKLDVARKNSCQIEHTGYTKIRKEQVWVVLVHRGGGEVRPKTVPRHVRETAKTENRFWTDV